MKHRRIMLFATVVSGLVLLAGCSGSTAKPAGLNETNSPTTSATTPAATTPSAVANPEADAVLKAYRAYSAVKIQMFDTASFSSDLQHVAYGKALEDLTAAVASTRQAGFNYTGTPASSPVVASASGTTAQVTDCFGSPSWIPVYSDGPDKGKSAVAPGSSVTAHPITATLNKLTDGKWYVVDAVTGDPTC